MKDVPQWIVRIIEGENLSCNKCKKTFSKKQLMAIGIQESSLAPHDDTLCVGMYCSDCKEMTIFELKEMSLVEFAFEILEKETQPDNKKSGTIRKRSTDNKKDEEKKSDDSNTLRRVGAGSKRNRKSKISQKEVNDTVKFLKSVKTHEEFLVAMGLSPEEIVKYNYKPEKKNG